MPLIPDQISTEGNDPSSVAVLRRVEENEGEGLRAAVPDFLEPQHPVPPFLRFLRLLL